jgi:hypothetical protein
LQSIMVEQTASTTKSCSTQRQSPRNKQKPSKWHPPKCARVSQKIIATLLVDLMGGQRRQVPGSLRKDSIHFNDKGRCHIILGREKSTNRISRRFPIPDEVRLFALNTFQYSCIFDSDCTFVAGLHNTYTSNAFVAK